MFITLIYIQSLHLLTFIPRIEGNFVYYSDQIILAQLTNRLRY